MRKDLKKYVEELEKKAEEFKLTGNDLRNLFDLFYMIPSWSSTYEELVLNGMDDWFNEFHSKLDDVVIKKE